MFEITDRALERIRSQNKNNKYLRLGFKAGGCMGITQIFEFCDEKKENDIVVERDGITLLVDPKSAVQLDGAKLDWSRNLLKSELVWVFPNRRQKCSCGASIAL